MTISVHTGGKYKWAGLEGLLQLVQSDQGIIMISSLIMMISCATSKRKALLGPKCLPVKAKNLVPHGLRLKFLSFLPYWGQKVLDYAWNSSPSPFQIWYTIISIPWLDKLSYLAAFILSFDNDTTYTSAFYSLSMIDNKPSVVQSKISSLYILRTLEDMHLWNLDLSLVTAMLSEAASPDVGSAVAWLGLGRQGVCCQA